MFDWKDPRSHPNWKADAQAKRAAANRDADKNRPTRARGTPRPKHVNRPPPELDLVEVDLDSPPARNLRARPKRQYAEDSEHDQESQDWEDSELQEYSGDEFVEDAYGLTDDLMKLRF